MHFSFPVLFLDIGGTNVRAAFVSSPGARLTQPLHFRTTDYPSLEAAIAAIVSLQNMKPKSVIACAAGPVAGDRVKLTNSDWSIDGTRAAAELDLEQGLLLNDFEAQAFSLPALASAAYQVIGEQIDGRDNPQLVLGPGTGLGAAVLNQIERRYFVSTSEAGHVNFGPFEADEVVIWPYLERMASQRISAETILSGPGLLRLHRARLAARGKPVPEIDASMLVADAHDQPDGEAAESLRLFWRLMARFAGDLALAFNSTGGVTLAGGILPKIIKFVDEFDFRRCFENKAPFQEFMKEIPTRVITLPDSVLNGMVEIAANPHLFAIDYEHRVWRAFESRQMSSNA